MTNIANRKNKTIFALFPIGDIFLQTNAISKRIKLGMPDTTQMKALSKGFAGITNFNPFSYVMVQKKGFNVFKNPPFLFPQGYATRFKKMIFSH